MATYFRHPQLLIGIERAPAAWGIMLRHFPEREDDILSFLATLKGLQRQTEREFPDARTFIRPGFDGGPAKA